MPSDWYGSFAQLAAQEVEGTDYRIRALDRASAALVIAPHGGLIEPSTSAIAAAIAGDDLSLYSFEGLRAGRGHEELHITSRHFDEPRALALAASAHRIVSIHGRSRRGDPEAVWLGGRDMALRNAIATELPRAGFAVRNPGDALFGLDPLNICNRSRTGMGAQIEMPRAPRDLLVRDPARMAAFAGAIRAALAA